MFHPDDIKFVNNAISGMSEAMLQKIRILNPGSCILLGTAFKFPVITLVDMPDPVPLSQSCDINGTWYID